MQLIIEAEAKDGFRMLGNLPRADWLLAIGLAYAVLRLYGFLTFLRCGNEKNVLTLQDFNKVTYCLLLCDIAVYL